MPVSKTASPYIKLIFVVIYILFITIFDSYFYGYIYQQKIQKENKEYQFLSWVFEESGEESLTEHITVTRYRVIQKSLEIVGIFIIFYYIGLWAAVGLLISHYLLTYDLLFYIFLNQTDTFNDFYILYQPYWLQNWYQIGYFILQPFNTAYFYTSGFAGLLIAIAFCYIPDKKYRRPFVQKSKK